MGRMLYKVLFLGAVLHNNNTVEELFGGASEVSFQPIRKAGAYAKITSALTSDPVSWARFW